MPIRNTDTAYGLPSQILHWGMAGVIALCFVVGLGMEELPKGDFKGMVYAFHKSLGVMAILLLALRLDWRVSNPAPRAVPNPSVWMERAAKLAHLLLYLLMLGVPVTGILMSFANGKPVTFFGLFTLPPVIGPDKGLKHLFGDLHEGMANGLLVLVGLHAAAAVWHQIVLRDGVLGRMLPAGWLQRA
ncbi:MAG: cytochrome b [Rhodospirillales bacterium]|nr:cytochrome b [Rhodospirillales bacterium]